jgi:hypothetical protein
MQLLNAKQTSLISLISVATAAVIMCGCGGSQKLLAIKTYKKVAVVEISSSKIIDWANQENANSTGSSIQSTAKFFGALSQGKSLSEAATAANHDATNALKLCAGSLFTTLVESDVVEVESEDFVKSNSYYQTLVSDKHVADFEIPADGYKLLEDEQERYAEVCKSLGVDAIFTIRISFEKERFAGSGASGVAKGSATAFVHLYDVTGEEIWSDQNHELSDNSTGMISGAYKFDEMEKLCSEAAISATKKCMLKLKKDIENLEKK